MFTRRGKYVVRRLPSRTEVGSATTLLDAADVAMEDARRGPGKYVIEQPLIEVDVSKAYGVLAAAGGVPTPPAVPDGLTVTDVGVTDASAQCSAVADATAYQWFVSGVPYQVTATPSVYVSGLSAATAYTVQVAALRDGVSSAVSAPVSFTTLEMEPPVWQAVPAQDLTVGAAFDLDLAAYAISQGGGTPSFSVVSGSLPAGLSIVGTRITGTPGAVETQTPVIRATAAGGTADSAAITMESLNADVTAPDAPTNFAAAGYSSSQVRLTWTNPAGDAVVAGERASGFQRVDIYRDGAKVDQVLSTAADPESYLATWNAVALWKVRSVDFVTPNPNKGAFTAELSAGPLVAAANPPQSVVATRTGSTAATVTWAAGDGPAPSSYRLYMATALGGPYAVKVAAAVSPQAVTSGFTGTQTPYFYVTAMIAGEETVASAIVSATLGTVGTVVDASFDTGTLTNNGSQGPSTAGWRLLSGPNSGGAYDAFDAASGDVPCVLATDRVRYTGRSLRTRLTFHTGAAVMPTANTRFYPSAAWYHKAGSLADVRAHRNEVRAMWGDPVAQVDYWLGCSVYMPGPGDTLGYQQTYANAWFGAQRYPFQLHGPTGGRNPVLYIATDLGWRHLATVTHPAAAPIVRYQRGGDTYGTLAVAAQKSSADAVRVEWSAPTSGPAVTHYRVFRSVRPQGTFEQVGTDIAVGENSTQTITTPRAGTTDAVMTLGRTTAAGASVFFFEEVGAGQNNDGWWSSVYVCVRAVYAGDTLGPASLVCPAPRDYVGVGWLGYNRTYLSGQADDGGPSGAVALLPLSEAAGHWTDFVMHYRLSSSVSTAPDSVVNANGLIEVFVNEDDTPSIYESGIKLGEGSGSVHFWKAGVYHGRIDGLLADNDVPPDWPKRFDVWIDEVRQTTKTGGLTTQTDSSDAAYVAVKPRGVRT